mgnify:CR=1 FL=1
MCIRDSPKKSELEIVDVTVEPTDTSAVIRWRTTQSAAGTLAYGRLQGSPGRPVSSNPSGEHTVALADLASDTPYWFQITAATTQGERVSSAPDSFRTSISADLSDTTPPVISNVQVTGITQTAATVTWTTDEGATSKVEWGASTGYEKPAVSDNALVTKHSLPLSGLQPDTTYNFRLTSTDFFDNSVITSNLTFKTKRNPGGIVSDLSLIHISEPTRPY